QERRVVPAAHARRSRGDSTQPHRLLHHPVRRQLAIDRRARRAGAGEGDDTGDHERACGERSAARQGAPENRHPGMILRRIGQGLLGGIGLAYGYLIYAYLTIPDVRPLRTTNPATTAFIELRADEARARRQTPRRVQRWVSYRSVSSDLKRAVL